MYTLVLTLSSLSAPPLPLTLGLTLALALAQQKRLLGERRVRKIESVEPHLAGKVTGMLPWPLERATHSGGMLERCLEATCKLACKVPTRTSASEMHSSASETHSSASSSRTLVILIVAAVACAIFAPLLALGLRQRVGHCAASVRRPHRLTRPALQSARGCALPPPAPPGAPTWLARPPESSQETTRGHLARVALDSLEKKD